MRDFFEIPFTIFVQETWLSLPTPPSSPSAPPPPSKKLVAIGQTAGKKEIKQGSFCRGGEERVSIVILPRNIPIQRKQFTDFVADSN